MEAQEIINPSTGNIERNIILNPEESSAVLNRLDPSIRAMVEERLGVQETQPTALPANIAMTAEEFERICDEAVGVPTSSESTSNTPSWIPSSVPFDSMEPVSPVEEISDEFEPTFTGITDEEYAETDHEEEGDELDEIRPEPIINFENDEVDGHIMELNESSPSQETEPESSEPPTLDLTQLNTILSVDTHSRFSGAEWYEFISHQSVLIGGAGGISSWLALLLSRTNVAEMFLYDNDEVERANLSGQFFNVRQVGRAKVAAVSDAINAYSDYYRVSYTREPYTSDSQAWDIMMCGFDNMAARKVFFNNWQKHQQFFTPEMHSNCLLIDGRLSAETLQVFCIQGDDPNAIRTYRDKYLFDDSEAEPTVCSYKQTSFMANMIGAMMVNCFVNWCANKVGGFRPVPFFIEYDAITMQFKFNMEAV